MKNIVTALSVALLIMAVSFAVYYGIHKHNEKYELAPSSDQLDSVGGEFLLMKNAYLPYPSGELTFSPMVDLPTRKCSNMDENSGLPEGRFVKGHYNAVYTPDLLWCKNGNCSGTNVFFINAGEVFYNTCGKTFVSMDPERASPSEKHKMATLTMQPDGQLCMKKSNDPRPTCFVPVFQSVQYPVLNIGLDMEGRFYVLSATPASTGLEIPIYINQSPTDNTKARIMPSPSVTTGNGRVPYATLLSDCSFGVFDGDHKFQYRVHIPM